MAPEIVHDELRSFFLTSENPDLTASDLTQAIQTVGSEYRASRVYFEANECFLIEHCGHYLIYGSEYRVAVAAHLPGPRDHRKALKGRGKPTMFLCDVPLSQLSGFWLEEYAGSVLEMMFSQLLEGDDFDPVIHDGAGFWIGTTLAPEHIVGHYHPNSIPDPLNGFHRETFDVDA